MALNFYFDYVTDVGIPYPNLGRTVAKPGTPQWHQFDNQWPFVSHFRPLLYLSEAARTPRYITAHDQQPWETAWYPIQFGWFDFCIDYIRLIPESTMELLRKGKLKLLFCYHEGDNPHEIVDRIDIMCQSNDLPLDIWRLISSNSAASDIDKCLYFNDHESFFRLRNRKQRAPGVGKTNPDIKYVFTCLIRQHKDWRLAFMADLWHQKLLDQSYWSYNTAGTPVNFNITSLPVNAALLPDLDNQVESFKELIPKFCDEMTSDQHNDHSQVDTEGYVKSMCNIVFETNFDNGGSGAFITEKTWKCIKYGQPFVIVSAPHSLRTLRDQGYKVFDQIIDNSYDDVFDNTERWQKIKQTLAEIKQRNTDEWWRDCYADALHNQKLFENRRRDGVDDLVKFLQHG
jgi:hypothetical protein